jgi:hypothetical protein
MRLFFPTALIAGALVITPAMAEDFTAISTTAMSITGDISFDDSEIVFSDGQSLVFDELVEDVLVVDGEEVAASVYSVAEPQVLELLNGNTLCGDAPVTYVATWAGTDDLTIVAMFDTQEAPGSDAEMCASFTYE